jgi:hypothetical protein
MSNFTSRRAAAGLATAGALLLGALAAAPQAGAQPVYVCQKVGSTFHVVTSKQKCKKGETKLSLGVSSAGAMGTAGPAGPAGPAGVTGAVGAAGPAGPPGLTGPEGPAGKNGAAAAQGERGPAGVQGATGPAGPTGATGVAGATGSTGSTGSTGAKGATGSVGAIVKETGTNNGAAPHGAVAVDGNGTIEVPCPAGDVLVGGGFKPDSSEVRAVTSAPDAAGTGWEYAYVNETSAEIKAGEMAAYAFCGPS